MEPKPKESGRHSTKTTGYFKKINITRDEEAYFTIMKGLI